VPNFGDNSINLALNAASSACLDRLHESSLRILSETGVDVHSPELREMLQAAGAEVSDGLRVRIPAELVERALATAPSRIVVHDRHGDPAMVLEGTNSYFGTGSDLRFTIDHNTGERRYTTLADIARAARLSDKLENLDFVMSYGLPNEVSDSIAEVEEFRAMLENTRKPPIMCIFSGKDMSQRIHDLACNSLGGSKSFKDAPNYMVYGQFVSPFQHEIMATDRLVFCADNFVPIIYVPTIMMGASGPVTLAGAIAVANAECLAGLTMHQLRSPGAPFIYGGCISPLDMRTTVFSYGSPEWRIADFVLSQLSQRYDLPIFGTGGTTDACGIDVQAGAEWAYSLLTCALAGTNIIHDVGYLEAGMSGSLEALVICNEIVGMVKRAVSGFEINDDTLALDMVKKVGPGGHFMEEDHTLDQFRKVIWYPSIFDRNRYDERRDNLLQRAAAKVSQLLEE
jgi:trimethylamine---corrinoid protein Co-methyltransferase